MHRTGSHPPADSRRALIGRAPSEVAMHDGKTANPPHRGDDADRVGPRLPGQRRRPRRPPRPHDPARRPRCRTRWTGTPCDGTALSVAVPRHRPRRARVRLGDRRAGDGYASTTTGSGPLRRQADVRLVAWVNWRHGDALACAPGAGRRTARQPADPPRIPRRSMTAANGQTRASPDDHLFDHGGRERRGSTGEARHTPCPRPVRPATSRPLRLDASTRRPVASAHNRRALIKSGRGTGPMKPRQPTDVESARCQVRAGPPAR